MRLAEQGAGRLLTLTLGIAAAREVQSDVEERYALIKALSL